MASISWTDLTGAATLTHIAHGTVASRFRNWRPLARAHGPKAHEMESRQRHSFKFGDVYGASFTFDGIPHTQMDKMDRLVLHLDDGGTITVTTDDASSRVYTCCLAPDADLPFPELADPALLEYAMHFELVNVGETPTSMLCVY